MAVHLYHQLISPLISKISMITKEANPRAAADRCRHKRSQGSLNLQIWFLGQNVYHVTRSQTHRQTMDTEDTLSRFQEFVIQPFIKDRSNIGKDGLPAWTTLRHLLGRSLMIVEGKNPETLRECTQ